jgi:hypothetical protein
VAGGCSGASKPDNQTFWANTAKNEPFAVYCGVVPSPWFFNGGNSTWGTSGVVTAQYKTSAGAQIDIQEGATSSTFCTPHIASLGTAHFGSTLIGSLYSITGGFALCVADTYRYEAKGTNVTQTTFVNIAAAMMKVPKS